MAQSRDSSNSPDVRDITSALYEFEKQNSCRIILTIRSCGSQGGEGIWYEAKAVSLPSAGAVPALLASAQLSCGQANTVTVWGAVIRLLYMIDAELAEKEFSMLKK